MESEHTDLPYANPFTISTIPALSGAAVDKFSKPTTVNSRMVCKQLIILILPADTLERGSVR